MNNIQSQTIHTVQAPDLYFGSGNDRLNRYTTRWVKISPNNLIKSATIKLDNNKLVKYGYRSDGSAYIKKDYSNNSKQQLN